MKPPHPEMPRALALWNAGRGAEAVAIFSRLAAQGEALALAIMGEMKWRGGVVPQNLGEARDLLRRAGEAGHASSAGLYTNLLAIGMAGPRDWPGALKRLRQEARTDEKRRRVLAILERMKLTDKGDPIALPGPEPLSQSPEVTLFPRLFSAAECDFLRSVAEPRYEPSFVNDSQGRQVRDPIRTSDGSTIQWLHEDPAVHALNRRLAAASGTTWEQGEAVQVLRYQPGQQYHTHFDFVRTSENQRVLTALVYLNEDFEGGETCFVKTGLQVKGRKGDAIVFRNTTPDRKVDPMSEHAGLPVTRGTKYLASRWIREQRWVP